MPDSIFKDHDVTVYQDRLKIHLYYFPVGDKTIDFKDIESISTADQLGLDPIEMKGWGMGLSDIWWSANVVQRGLIQITGAPEGVTPVIIKCKGDGIRKGFSTKRWPELKKVLMDKVPDAFHVGQS